MILELLFSIALIITGGHVIDGKLKLHHYSDEDYKEIFFLKEKREISKKCIKHSKVEVISYKNFKHTDGTTKKNYKIRETDND
jgi:hypothetical protein